jgi:hypothetical protein
MRISPLYLISSLLASAHVLYAFPTTATADGVSVVADVPYHAELSERAPKKEVPLNKEEKSWLPGAVTEVCQEFLILPSQ